MARLPQLNAEVTTSVKQRLAALEEELSDRRARQHEIVGVLLLAAKASAVTAGRLTKYRRELTAERVEAETGE